MAYERALSPQSLQSVYTYLRQLRATGRPVSDADMRAAYTSALTAEANTSLANRSASQAQSNWEKTFAESQSRANQAQANWQKQFDLLNEQYNKQNQAENIMGIGSMLMSAPKIYRGLKSMTGAQSQLATNPALTGNTSFVPGYKPGDLTSGITDLPAVSRPAPALTGDKSGYFEMPETGTIPTMGFGETMRNIAPGALLGSGLGYMVAQGTGNPWIGAGVGLAAEELLPMLEGGKGIIGTILDGLGLF